MSADVKAYLTADDSPALKQRRRGDCLRLSVCEEAWIKARKRPSEVSAGLPAVRKPISIDKRHLP